MRIDKWLWTARLFKTRALAAAARRVSAVEAANLYEETEQSVAEGRRQAELRRLAGPVDLGARPTKRDRRRYNRSRH